MAVASKVSFEINVNSIQLISDSLELAKKGCLTRADKTNRLYTKDVVEERKYHDQNILKLLYDPQTSGGLLISIKESQSQELLKRLLDQNLNAFFVGKVVSNAGKQSF